MRIKALASRRSAWKSGMLALACALMIGMPGGTRAQLPPGDTGDAPDSTNHFGMAMSAYPGVPANFPTVFDPGAGAPSGPLHIQPKQVGWIGANVSPEQDADLAGDADGILNLIPSMNNPNNDGFDDGIFNNAVNPGGEIVLPQCQQTQFNYVIRGAPGIATQGRVNVWFDWNSDGDWQDVFTCTKPNGTVVNVPEWAVQNQVVAINAGPTIVASQPFVSLHPGGKERHWMRITLSQSIAAPGGGPGGLPDGRGWGNPEPFGETQDHLIARTNGANFCDVNDPDID